jgi:acetoin utilization deacetylase AcuC-like enzyme
VLLTGGGLLAAARRALTDGIAAAVVSGFHHAHADHGEGFCTFNSLVVAAELLHAAGVPRIAVLDMDLHYGNGTASLAPARPYFFTMSIYGNDYHQNAAFREVDTVRHTDGANHQSIALANGSGRDAMLAALDGGVGRILAWGRPDLVLYQAGADPYREDPYSPLTLDHDDLRERDRRVFEWARAAGIPIAWVRRGYPDTSKVVRVHLNTFDAALEVYG